MDAIAHDAAVCDDASPPPTQSFSLDDWPQVAAASGPDLTAEGSPVTTSVDGLPAGVLLSPDGAWLLTAVIGGTTGLSVLQRTGASLVVDHGVPAPSGQQPFGTALSKDGKTVAMGLSDEVALYDIAKVESDPGNALIASIPTQSDKKQSIDVAFSNDGKLAFVALEYDKQVAVIDVEQRAYVGAIPIAGDAVTGLAVSPDGAFLYVVCEVAEEFSAANPAPALDQNVGAITVASIAKAATAPDTSVLGRAFVGRGPVRVRVSPDGATLWVTARGSNALIALDAQTLLSSTCNPLLATIPVGPSPVGLTVLDRGKVVAVADSNRFAQPQENQTVTFVDATSRSVIGQVTVGAFPREVTADDTTLFVSNFNSRSISGIDLAALPLP